jgi:hypothetical protein
MSKVLSQLAASEVEMAQRIRASLGNVARDLETAIETESLAQQARKSAEEGYQVQEDEVLALAYATGEIDGKNADARKMQESALLTLARNHGTLADAWSTRANMVNEYEQAKVYREQCSVRFSANKHAAMLTESILQVLAE